MLSSNEHSIYLSAALDQEACKATLLSALVSRVDGLRSRGVTDEQICTALYQLSLDPYQMNDDVIVDVMEWIRSSETN